MKLRTLTISTVVLSFICFLPFSALGKGNRNYLVIKGGAYYPAGDLSSSEGFNFAGGVNGEFAFGRYFDPILALELSIGRFTTDGKVTSTNDTLGDFSSEDEITVVPIMFNIRPVIVANNWEVYALAGFGIYLANFKSTVDSSKLGDFIMDSEDSVFGINFGIGTNYNVSKHVFFGMDGKYIITGQETFEETVSDVPVEVQANLNGFQITATLGIRF